MYLISVDFSKNNLLIGQMNIQSFYNLPIMNYTLSETNLNAFADSGISKAYMFNAEEICNSTLFEINSVNENEIRKLFSLLNEVEHVILFRNDTYFECFVQKTDQLITEGIFCIKDSNDFCFAISMSVGMLLKLLSRGFTCRDLFLNSKKIADNNMRADAYVKKLENIKDYKALLFDILNRKTLFKPPHIAEGVFTQGFIPKGDFSIIPPVYIDENVQIESGTNIGPNTVIYKNTLISHESSVKNSVLLENVYISSDCYIDGSVCCENASVKRNSAIFSGSVIGANSLIGEDVILDNNSIVSHDVKCDNFIKLNFNSVQKDGFINKFQGLSPDKAAILGSGVATVFNKPRILVCSDGSVNSLSIKLAFLSGVICSGAQCYDIGVTFKSHVFFSSLFCECDYSVFIKGGINGTAIEIFNNKNEPISNADCYNLLNYCVKNEFRFADKNECKNVRQIKGLKRIYIREIVGLFEYEINFLPIIECKNSVLQKIIEEVFEKIGINREAKKKILINLNEDGTRVNIEFNGRLYKQKDLKRLVFYYQKSGKTSKFLSCDIYKNLWKFDSVFLLFTALDLVVRSGDEIGLLMRNTPDFYINSKTVSRKIKIGKIADRLSDLNTVFYKNKTFNIPLKNSFVKVVDNKKTNELKIMCCSENMALSAEICNIFEKYLGGG